MKTNQQQILEMMRDGGPRSIQRVAAALSITTDGAGDALKRLVRRHLVIRTGRNEYALSQPGLAWLNAGHTLRPGPASGESHRQAGSLRQMAWRALRLRPGTVLSTDDLVRLCTNDKLAAEVSDIRRALNKYLWALTKSGYLLEMKRRDSPLREKSNGAKRYRLIQDTGPETPVYAHNLGLVFDPNTQLTHNIGPLNE